MHDIGIAKRLDRDKKLQERAAESVRRQMGLTDHDPVNKPDHYMLPGGIEVRDIQEYVCEDFEGADAHDIANALKYLLRCPFKGNCDEDIAKAVWHLRRYLDKRGLWAYGD